MLFSVNILVEQGVAAVIVIALFYIYTLLDVHQHTFNRSRVATLL